MCNIAGYVGNKQAAPILIEMLKREECFDGGFSAGVATIHEGKIHYRKVVGTVEDLINSTDVLSLPGTIGIAHTRPGGDRIEHAHPFIAPDEKLAMVSNGDTPMDDLIQQRKDILTMLEKEGYDFPYSYVNADDKKSGRLANGECVGKNYVILAYTQYFLDRGKSFDEAHALAEDGMFAENVSVMLKHDIPDKISVVRATRPMQVMLNGDETYIATCNFAFPEIPGAIISSLPELHSCNIFAGGYEVTKYRIESHGTCPITPMTYIKAYDSIINMFNEADVLTFHELQVKLDKEHPEIWHEKHHYTQYAKVVYDILWQLHLEGRLNIEIRKHENARHQVRDLAYMSLK